MPEIKQSILKSHNIQQNSNHHKVVCCVTCACSNRTQSPYTQDISYLIHSIFDVRKGNPLYPHNPTYGTIEA
uniref:Uncharacterized protein n=1 Tax=Rhizophora mucronata TaxID=61149 RepID=A0A2P2N2E6_RHIMU